MKLYFAGADCYFKSLYKQGVKNILISYPFYKKIKKQEFKKVFNKYNLFLDSGAFSVFTGNVKIDLDEMIKDYKTYKFIKLKCGLDVIGDAESTKNNCLKMKKAGLDIIPTFHYGGKEKYLEYYCQNFKIIALGGVAQLRTRKDYLDKWLNNCFSIIKKYKNRVKVHGFAITSSSLLMKYPFYSVDSTSWLAGAKYATVYRFKQGKLLAAEARTKKDLKGKGLLKFDNPLQYLDINSLNKKKYKERCNQNIKAFLKLEDFVTRLWEKRGIKYD